MSGTGIALRCANTGPMAGVSIDPFKYPADLGRLVEALILYDRVVVVTETLNEFIGLLYAFGEQAVSRLLEDGTISFLFNQDIPVVAKDQGPVRMAAMQHASEDHPRKRDPTLRTNEDFEFFLSRRTGSYSFLPDYAPPSEDLAGLLRNSTHLAPAAFSQCLRNGFAAWLNDPSNLAKTETTIGTLWGRPCLLSHVLEAGQDCPTLRTSLTVDEAGYVDAGLDRDLYLAFDLYSETVLTPVASADMATLSQQQLDLVVDPLVGNRATALQTILEIEKFPRVGDAVYRAPVSGDDLMTLRNHQDTVRLRKWLAAGDHSDADEIVSRYVKALGKTVRDDSLGFSSVRVLGSIGASLLNPIAGALANVGDWLFSKFYYRKEWHPRVFIDGILSETLTQSRATTRGIYIPASPLTLIDGGWMPTEINHSIQDGIRGLFRHQRGGSLDMAWEPRAEAYRVFNEAWDLLTERTNQTPIILQCFECQQLNRITTRGSRLPTPICGKCKRRLVPMVPT